jgi:transposase
VSDIKAVSLLLENMAGISALMADKGYDSDAFRAQLREKKIQPVIPGRSHRKRKTSLDKARYRDRHLVENAFCRLKDFRAHRHPLRQTRPKLLVRRLHRLLDLNESRA